MSIKLSQGIKLILACLLHDYHGKSPTLPAGEVLKGRFFARFDAGTDIGADRAQE